MLVAAYSDEKIATVTPLSDSANFLSEKIATTIGVQRLKPDETAYLIESLSEHLKPKIENIQMNHASTLKEMLLMILVCLMEMN